MKFQINNFILLLSAYLFLAFTTTEEARISNVDSFENQEFTSVDCKKFSDLGEFESDAISDDYSIYRDRMKTSSFKSAYPLWKRVYQKSPKTNGRLDYVFRDGIKIYTDFHQNTTDTILQQKYVDTMLMIYEKAVICFPEKTAYYYSKQGVDMFYKYKGTMTEEAIFKLLKTAAELDGNDSRVSTIIPLSSLNFKLFSADKINRDDALKTLENVNSIVAENIKNCKDEKECNAWTQVEQYTQELAIRFEGQKDFYDCKFYMEKYYASFETNPNDCELIEELYRKFKAAGCNAENPKMQNLASTFKDKCMQPTTDSDLACGRENLDNGNYAASIECYERYISKTDNVEAKANFKLRIAKIYYSYLRNNSRAREYAQTAAQLKSNWGEPYILIGKLYASSGSQCGPGTGFDSQVVTWVAIDKWNEAKRIDPSIASEANQLINQYSKYMPSREDIFSRSMKEGSSYKVKCWIQESTTVRVGK